MSSEPLVSFIVLSYNYEQYVATTLRSILDQTVRDLEVVVVDDASTDGSREVIRSFSDPRIRLEVNERNLGGAGSYNRAVSLARGRFLVNLDADDWIHPRKTELQLAAFERDPALDILGTYVEYVAADGSPHPKAADLEAWTNHPQDFNLVDTWIVRNGLCRSSTMVRRAAHERIGLDDAAMVRAPDFELWTRALRDGCRFGLLEEKLTWLRVHSRGVTHGDPRGQYRETCHLLLKNVVPAIEARATYASLGRVVRWIVGHEQFAWMTPAERYRLLGLFSCSGGLEEFTAFERALATPDPALETAGRRCLALCGAGDTDLQVTKLHYDFEAVAAERDWFQQQAAAWEQTAGELRAEAAKWRRRTERIPFYKMLRGVKRLVVPGPRATRPTR